MFVSFCSKELNHLKRPVSPGLNSQLSTKKCTDLDFFLVAQFKKNQNTDGNKRLTDCSLLHFSFTPAFSFWNITVVAIVIAIVGILFFQ